MQIQSQDTVIKPPMACFEFVWDVADKAKLCRGEEKPININKMAKITVTSVVSSRASRVL